VLERDHGRAFGCGTDEDRIVSPPCRPHAELIASRRATVAMHDFRESDTTPAVRDRSAGVRDTPPRCSKHKGRSPSSRASSSSWRLAPDGARNPDHSAQAVRACFWDDPSFPILRWIVVERGHTSAQHAFTTSASGRMR